jgi:hypothetical protein
MMVVGFEVGRDRVKMLFGPGDRASLVFPDDVSVAFHESIV